MALKISARGQVPPFIVMDVMRVAEERRRAGADILHLAAGQPSTPAPRRVLDAAKAALESDRLGYTVALGTERLRSLIAGFYGSEYGASVDPAQVIITTGSSGAFLLSFLTAFDVGDRVGIATPGYPAYRNILTSLGIEPVPIRVGADTRFQPTAEVMRSVGQKLDGLIVASPSNPTGSMLPPGELPLLADYCESMGIRLVSDEIYHGIVFGPPAETAAGRGGGAIVINSFSKYFSMTGWRLGWMIVPPDMVRTVECLAQNLFIAPPTLSQLAAEAVFDCRDELDANVRRYRENRDILLEELPAAGFDRLAPADGAFYLYADIGYMTNDSEEFCRRMLVETGIAATPGIDFDPVEGHRAMRFSFAGATADIRQAVRRLRTWRAA